MPAPGVRGTGLRSLRRRAGVPVSAIARHVSVREATVYNWEAGRVRIPDTHVPALAVLLGTAPDVLRHRLRAAPPAPPPGPVRPLRRLRRRTGLTQEAVARRIGSSRYRVGAWERGEVPPLWAVRRLAGVYGVPVSRVAAAAGVTAPPLLDPRRWTPGDLPDALATLRAWTGLTQREAARRCGLHPTSLKAWEAGRTVPSARSRRRLEELYGLPDSALLAACPGA